MIADWMSPECLANPTLNVTHAEFQFRFVPKGHERPKQCTFSVSFPNSSNLKSLVEDRRLLAEKYLRRWKIQRD
jgi:hypothetical protein